MKISITILFLLLSALVYSQDYFFGSYIYSQQKDIITFRASQNDDLVRFATRSGDSLYYHSDYTSYKIAGDSTQQFVFHNIVGETHYIESNHNDLRSIVMYGTGIGNLDLSQCRRLYYLYLSGTSFSSSFDLASISSLERLEFSQERSLTLDISKISNLRFCYIANGPYLNTLTFNNPKLEYIVASNGALSSVSLGIPNALTNTLYFYGCALPQSEVDEILKWAVDGGRTSASGTCYLELQGGTNSCPSSTGIGYAQILTNRGWTVNYNQCGGSSNPPSVITTQPSYISMYSATSGGNVTSQGSSNVTARGVCWSTSQNPTISNSHTIDGTGQGTFTSSITGLNAGTLYYIRAYATNSYGTSYGNQYSFTTIAEFTNPTLTTIVPNNVSTNTASSGGHILSDGGGSIVEKGVCYSTSPTPTYSGTKTNDGSGIADFISTISGLSPNTTYYVRAYARNRVLSGGFYIYALGYGQEESFTTTGSGTLPTVSTYSANTITASSAYSGGNVSSEGDSNVTLRGVCYSTSQNPTIVNNKTNDGSGAGSFISSITGLECGTTYYVRAYATNIFGTSYGNQINFTTSGNLPSIIAASCNSTSSYSVDVTATISDDGGCSVTSRGFQYSTDASFNTILGSVTASGTGIGQYYATISNLDCGVHYYFRPWATNSIGTYYATSLVGTGCTTISHPEYALTSGFFYAITSSTCFNGDFTSSFSSACEAKAEYFNSSCAASLVGRTYRTQSGNLNVGDKLYYSNGCEVMLTGYHMASNFDIVYIVDGVIQSITPCP